MNSSTFNRTIIIIVLAGCCTCSANAQDSVASESQHLLGLSTGLSYHSVRDGIISPLMYKGSQLPILLTYDYRSLRSRQTMTAFYNNLDLTSPISNKATSSHIAKNVNAFLDYSYTRKVFTFDQLNTDCFLGGSVSGFLNWRTFYYSRQSNEISPEAMMSLSFDALLETKVDQSSDDLLSFHLAVPLISYVLLDDRYNAKVSDTFDELDLERNVLGQILAKGNVVTVNRLIKVQTELSYSMFISRSIRCEFQHRFLYYFILRHKSGLDARSVSNQFLVGLSIAL